MIQLMNTNKEWVDWRYYNPTDKLSAELNQWTRTSDVTQTLSLSKIGLYCAYYVSNGASNLTTTGTTLNSFSAGGSPGYREDIIYSDGTASLSIRLSPSTWNAHMDVYYIGPWTNISNPQVFDSYDATIEQTKVYTGQNQFIHFALCGTASRYNRTFITENIEPENIKVWDPNVGNMYSAVAINISGTVTCKGTSGVISSNVGRLECFSYTLVL